MSDNRCEAALKFGRFPGVYKPRVLTIPGLIIHLGPGWTLCNLGLTLTISIVVIDRRVTALG